MKTLIKSIKRLALALCFATPIVSWAAEPVVVWDGASSDYNFTELTREGYTLSNIGGDDMNTVADDGSYLQIGSQNAKKAIVLSKEDGTDIGYCTVIIKFSDMPADGGANRALLTFTKGTSNSFIGVAQERNLTRTSSFIWDNDIWNNSANVRTANVFDENEHTAALAYEYSHGSAFYIDGISRGAAGGLKSYGYSIPSVTIGGVHYDNSGKFYSLPGMKVKAVALFSGWLTADEVANYVFPSAAGSLYTASVTENTAWADIAWDRTLPEDVSEATLQLAIGEGATVTAPASLTVGSLSVTGAGTLTFAEGDNTLSGNVVASAKVTVPAGASLTTNGDIGLSNGGNTLAGTFDVATGTVNLTTAEKGISGTLTIREGAKLVSHTGDAINYSGDSTINVYGTLDLGTHRWSIRTVDHCVFNLFPGASVTGAGDGYGILDLFDTTSKFNVYKGESGGTATISGPVRFRNSNTPIWIAEDTTLKLAGGLLDNYSWTSGGGFSNNGAGTLEISGSVTIAGNSTINDGKVVLNNTTSSDGTAITVNSGKTLEVIATAANKVVPVKASIADGATFTFTGSGKASGSLTFAAAPASTVQTFLQNNWTGTATLNYAITGASGGTAFKACLYGNADSTVVLGQGATNIFFANAAGNGPGVGTKLYFKGNVSIKNGWAYDMNYDASERTNETVFPELGADEGVTFTTRQDSGRTTYFKITNLKNFAGTIDVRAKTDVLIENVELSELPAEGTLVVKATKADAETSVIAGSVTVGEDTVDLVYGTVGEQTGLMRPVTVDITITPVDNATASVTVNGAAVTPEEGVITVKVGDAVSVTYTAAEGYTVTGSPVEFTATAETTAVDTTNVKAKAHVAWIYDENSALVGSPYTDELTAVQAFLQFSVGESIRFLAQSTYHDLLLNACTYDEETFTYTRIPPEPTVATITIGEKVYEYSTLAAAVAEGKNATVVLVDDVTLDARVEPNPGADATMTIDLGGFTITRTGTSGNGSVFDVKSGTVTIQNGTIDCTQNDAAIVADGVYAITARSGANVTLSGLTVTVDSQAGACVYPFDGAEVTILSGTYENTTATDYQYKAGWRGMAVNQANVSTQLITIYGGSFAQVNPELGDDSWASAGNGFLADGRIAKLQEGYWVVQAGTWVAQITGGAKFESLADAVAAVPAEGTVTLLTDVTLETRVEPSKSMTIDLGAFTITRTGTSGNGSVFDVKSGTVTIKNGMIDCMQDDTAIVADGVYAITARSGANVTLEGLTIAVDSQAGACVYPFSGAAVTINSGTYRNDTTEDYQYKAGWRGMAVNQANVAQQLITIYGGSFKQNDPALGDDSWASAGNGFLASGYASTWNPSTGYYDVAEVQEVPVTPGAQTEPVDTQEAAEAEAAKVVPSVPAAVAEKLTPAQEAAYTEMFEAKVVEVTVDQATKYAVEVVMKADVAADIQVAVDAEAEDLAKAAVDAAADAVAGGEATVTTTPGLYYVVEAGTELEGIAPESCTLATGTSLNLTIPNKGTKGFYKLRVSVTPVAVE